MYCIILFVLLQCVVVNGAQRWNTPNTQHHINIYHEDMVTEIPSVEDQFPYTLTISSHGKLVSRCPKNENKCLIYEQSGNSYTLFTSFTSQIQDPPQFYHDNTVFFRPLGSNTIVSHDGRIRRSFKNIELWTISSNFRYIAVYGGGMLEFGNIKNEDLDRIVRTTKMDKTVTCLKYSRLASRLAIGTEIGEIVVYNTQSFESMETKQVFRKQIHMGQINHMELDDEQNIAFSCSDDGTVKRWDMRNGKVLQTYVVGREISIHSFALERANNLVVASKGLLTLFDIQSGLKLAEKIQRSIPNVANSNTGDTFGIFAEGFTSVNNTLVPLTIKPNIDSSIARSLIVTQSPTISPFTIPPTTQQNKYPTCNNTYTFTDGCICNKTLPYEGIVYLELDCFYSIVKHPEHVVGVANSSIIFVIFVSSLFPLFHVFYLNKIPMLWDLGLVTFVSWLAKISSFVYVAFGHFESQLGFLAFLVFLVLPEIYATGWLLRHSTFNVSPWFHWILLLPYGVFIWSCFVVFFQLKFFTFRMVRELHPIRWNITETRKFQGYFAKVLFNELRMIEVFQGSLPQFILVLHNCNSIGYYEPSAHLILVCTGMNMAFFLFPFIYYAYYHDCSLVLIPIGFGTYPEENEFPPTATEVVGELETEDGIEAMGIVEATLVST